MNLKSKMFHIDLILRSTCHPEQKPEECFICAGDDVRKGGGIDHNQERGAAQSRSRSRSAGQNIFTHMVGDLSLFHNKTRPHA